MLTRGCGTLRATPWWGDAPVMHAAAYTGQSWNLSVDPATACCHLASARMFKFQIYSLDLLLIYSEDRISILSFRNTSGPLNLEP
jgi:hypothetical protein